MTSSISSTTNKDENGISSWEKSVTDVNNIDESFANARDLGYTRLNYARVTTVAELGKYNERDIYKIQVQSNGKLSISLRNSGSDDNVLDLSSYEDYINDLRRQLDPEGYAEELAKKAEEDAKKGLLEDTAPGMALKVYTIKNNKEVLIADSTADKDSQEYQNMKLILSGEYKATAGNYYIEVSHAEGADTSQDYPYAMQIMQGTSYKHDYVMTQAASADTTNKEISTTKDETLSSTNTGTSTISAAYAAQIQAVSDEGAANMLAAGYSNMASLTSDDSSSTAASLFSTLLSQ